EDHVYQPMLKEALALEDLRRRGRDLEAWMTNYPALFVDAVLRLRAKEAADAPSEALAAATLGEAEETLGACLQAMGLEWIAPQPGDAVTRDYEVVGEEAGLTEGRVAALRRPGFRWQGRLYLQPQVLRSVRREEARVESRESRVTADISLSPADRVES